MLKKTRPTGYVFRCKHSKEDKQKKSDLVKDTATNLTCRHEMSAPLRHLKVLSFEGLVFRSDICFVLSGQVWLVL